MIGNLVLLCMLFEGLKPFCTTLLLISAMTFVKDVSPLTTAATLEGIFGAAYFGVGRGLGGFVGGFSTELIGFVNTFQVLGLISLGTGLMYIFSTLLDGKIKSRRYTLENGKNCALSNEPATWCGSYSVSNNNTAI